MKITSVEAIPLAVPYRRPFAFASGRVTAADHVLVRITTDDGLVGHGEAPPRPYTYGETAVSIVATIRDLFAPVLVGADAFAREAIRADLARTVANNGARGAVDVALGTSWARRAGSRCTCCSGTPPTTSPPPPT